MQHDGSRKKGHYDPFRDRNSGWISGKQLEKASKFRKSDVQGGADFAKGKKVSEKKYGTTRFWRKCIQWWEHKEKTKVGRSEGGRTRMT